MIRNVMEQPMAGRMNAARIFCCGVRSVLENNKINALSLQVGMNLLLG